VNATHAESAGETVCAQGKLVSAIKIGVTMMTPINYYQIRELAL